jgi:DNA helicase-2/ATP-dependent DNA helicase PcrA
LPDLLAELNEPQRQAVTHVDGPLLVLAGAGSGKTRVITRRVAYLVQQGVAPWNILAITFTNKAAGEMRHRVDALNVPRGTLLCTFHGLCARLLGEFAAEANLARNYSIYDRDDQLRVVKDAVKKLELPPETFRPARVLALISNAKNEMKSPEQYALEMADDPFGRRAAEVYRSYQKMLDAGNALDFDDLLVRMAFLLRDRPDIRQLLGRRYKYILIDEYQDTNNAQYILAHGMAMEHENICVTGDPDQSIYAWRGADIRNILEFEADYPNAAVIRLEENYRSSRPILTAASKLIAHNSQRKDKTLWTRRQGGQDVHVVYCDDEHAEAREIARRIAQRRLAGGRYDEAAVFYRVNSLSRVLEDVFRKGGIPYRIARGVEFYNRKEVKDVLAYLRLMVNGSDDLSCRRIINTPARGIGATTVSRLAVAAGGLGLSLLEICRQPEAAGIKAGAAQKVRQFAGLIGKLASRLDRPASKVVESVIVDSGLRASFSSQGEEDKQIVANIDELVSTAAEFEQETPDALLPDFLHQVALVSDTDHFEGAGGAVTFMTLHAAKGLEFPAVFIAGCETGLLPMVRLDEDNRSGRDASWHSRRAAQAMEEERRLAFVGMTRAMHELTLTCARRRRVRGQLIPQAASQFIEEIGSEFVRFEDTTTIDTEGHVARRHHRGGFYDDVGERAAIERATDSARARGRPRGDQARGDQASGEFDMPDEPPPPPEYEHLAVNSRVRHRKFGLGKVIGLRNHWPQTRAEIIFDNFGHKTIILSHVRLEVLDSDEW